MRSLTLILIVCLTSLGAWIALGRRVDREASALRRAAVDALTCLGLAVVFLAANLAVGIVLVLGARAASGRFISLYVLNDASLAVLSLLQALLFHARARDRSTPS